MKTSAAPPSPHYQRKITIMSLEQKDLEVIESIIRKVSDDVTIASQRSSERLEERLDGAETRIYCRLGDIEEEIKRSYF